MLLKLFTCCKKPVLSRDQFEHGERFMCISTVHLLGNKTCTQLCGWQIQGHFDGSFNFCDTEFASIGFGMNSMGARFNPVSISIVNSESSEAYDAAITVTKKALYAAFKHCQGMRRCGL
jgi:hypothetical protein